MQNQFLQVHRQILNFVRITNMIDMGKNIIHCGDHGSGEVVKLCNNLLLAVSSHG